LKFEWDDKKNAANVKKHRLSFERAIRVFYDHNRVEGYDENHSDTETRFFTVGFADERPVYVIFTEPVPETIRIISARKAKKHELEVFYYGNG
jgi:uncharacterized DUF497 family protein